MTAFFLFAFHFFSSAQQCSDLFAAHEISVESSQVRPLTLPKVEVFRRNNGIGVQQYGDLSLEKWFELPPYVEQAYNFVGLTPEGRVYQVVDWHGKRRVARLLSGDKEFRDIYFIDGRILAATDRDGKVYLYSPERWARSPRGDAIRTGAMIWGGISFVTIAGVYMLIPEATQWNVDLASLPIPIPAAFIGVISALQTGFVMLNRYDYKNTFPDGFFKTDLIIASPDEAPAVLSALESDIVDHLRELNDFTIPDPMGLPPTQPEATTEDIR